MCGSHIRCSGKGPHMPHSAAGCAYPIGGVCGSHVRCSGKGPHMPHSVASCAYPFPLINEACPHAGMYVWRKKKTVKSESSQLWSLTFIRPLSFIGEQVIMLHPKRRHFSLVM